MIQLNFGKSEYTLYSPPQTVKDEKDMIVSIPEQGELAVLCEKEYLEEAKAVLTVLAPEKSERRLTAVNFDLKCNYSHDYALEKRIIMPWIEERREWVAIEYNKWVESMPRNDEFYSGPFALDEYCLQKILEACCIPEQKIKLADVAKTSPEQLKKISDEVQGQIYSIAHTSEGDIDECAVDWNHDRHIWTRSYREYGLGHSWSQGRELNQKACTALLDAFGLSSTDYKLEDIAKTSPGELARIGKHNPASSTLGDCRKASQVR